MPTNWSKVIGAISGAIGLFVLAVPILPDNVRIYILGAETALNGFLQIYQGIQSPPAQPAPTTAAPSKAQ